MINSVMIKVLFFVCISQWVLAQPLSLEEISTDNQSTQYLVAKVKKSKKKNSRRSKRKSGSKKVRRAELIESLKLAKEGQYEKASMKLFRISQSPAYRDKRMQIKYLLGLMLYKLQLYQASAFQFIHVVKNGDKRYIRQSIEKLSLAADYLGDDTLLNYAISKVNVNDFPKAHRDMLFYRIGEIQLKNKKYSEAARSFSKVREESSVYTQAKYSQGLAYAEARENSQALKTFEELIDFRADQQVNDDIRVAALIGKARVLYQDKKWEESLETYRDVPRDSIIWHDSVFESSWAMLRFGRFRSALSNFQTLHSSYYEDFYQPESLLLRGIVYLYICKYDEMEKVLNLFSEVYDPVYKGIKIYLKENKDSTESYQQVAQVESDAIKVDYSLVDKSKYKIPYIVAKKIFQEGDFQSQFNYIKKIEAEQTRLSQMSQEWQISAIGRYVKNVLKRRDSKAKSKTGRLIKYHLIQIKDELVDLFEQSGFIRFEMLKGKKDTVRQKMAGKDINDVLIDGDNERDYYIQNGYEYWPFKGEYWLDELGNYHYLGTQSCGS